MKKLFCLLLCLLLCLPALAEDAQKVLDMTGRKQIATKEIDGLIRQITDGGYGTVRLTGVRMDVKDQLRMIQALPQVHFEWTVSICGGRVDSRDIQVNLDRFDKTMGPIGLTNALTCLPNLRHVTMYKHRLALREMEKLMAAFPDIEFDWTVPVDRYLVRTDATAFSTNKGRQEPRYTAEQLMPLTYCRNLVALDLGHNNVSDLHFLTNWPHLKVLIIVDSKEPITDLTPLTDLNELEYVELFMQGITDLTPLANKPNLVDLNLCRNDITDLSPLWSCTSLERLWVAGNPNLTQAEIERFQAHVPGCRVEYRTNESTGAGWREHWRYNIMREGFEKRKYKPFVR